MDDAAELIGIIRGTTFHLELLRLHGVDSIPSAVTLPDTAPEASYTPNAKGLRVAFLAVPKDVSGEDELTLVAKIAGAMGLLPDDWSLFIESDPLEGRKMALDTAGLEYIVVFGEETSQALFGRDAKFGRLASLGETPVICTHAPFTLLKDDRLKKETWEHLQGAVKALKKTGA